MKCVNCGFENPEMSKFCGKCGKTLGGEKSSGKQNEKGQTSYKKFLPVVGVLVILLLGYLVMAPKTNDASNKLESALTSSNPTTEKTSDSSTSSGTSGASTPTSKSTAGTSSAIGAKSTSGSKTVSFAPESKESASIYFRSNGPNCCLSQYFVGYDYNNNAYDQTYLSYDMTGIPVNATITEATLDFSSYSREGDPFSYLGCMGVYEQEFGVPDAKDFFLGTPTDAIAKWCSDIELSSPLKSKNLASVLQNNLGKNRMQIRLQFDKNTDNNKQSDYFMIRSANIIVTYTTP